MAKSSELVDLIATKEPETTGQGETVVVTADVAFAGMTAQHGQIRLSLTRKQAEHLLGQLQAALVTVRVNAQRTR